MHQEAGSRTALVLIPFKAENDDVYHLGIKEILEKRGYSCTKTDEEHYFGAVTEKIFEKIAESDIIVAEVTEPNPNVYYEVGYAHGMGKEPILVAREGSKLPFDIQSLRCIFYKSNVSLRQHLDDCLQAVEKNALKEPDWDKDPSKLKLESQNVLRFLFENGSPQAAAACAEAARGVFAIMNDLRFLGYVKFNGNLRPASTIYLTESGRLAAKALLK